VPDVGVELGLVDVELVPYVDSGWVEVVELVPVLGVVAVELWSGCVVP
jgi:hypothetical protein